MSFQIKDTSEITRFYCVLCGKELTGARIPELISHFLITHIDQLIITEEPKKKGVTA